MNKMLVVALIVALNGCAAWEAVKAVADKDGMHNELQVGDRENRGTLGDSAAVGTVKAYKGGNVNLDQSSTKPKFLGEAEVVTINDAPWWLILLFGLALWIAPGPLKCFSLIKEAIRGRGPVIGSRI